MRNITVRKTLISVSFLIVAAAPFIVAADSHITNIHLTEYNGHFEAEETLANMKPGTYVFHVTNKAGKPVGFQVQDAKTEETLAKGMIKQNKTKEFKVEVGENGVRYRCPVNPTPWYEVSVSK
jgi:hypothetical protein